MSYKDKFFFCWYVGVGGKLCYQTYNADVIKPTSLQKHQISAKEFHNGILDTLTERYPYTGEVSSGEDGVRYVIT